MIEKRLFGRTGHPSSATLFGGAALGHVTQAQAERTLDSLLEYGVNHIDTANSYGESEKRIGPWLEGHRQEFFLATKTGDRTYQGAKAHLASSLDLLDSQRALFIAQIATIQVKLAQLQNQVTLYKVLGGGWTEPPTVAATSARP